MTPSHLHPTIKRISEGESVPFPAWLWHYSQLAWARYSDRFTSPVVDLTAYGYTHYAPDAPTPPSERPTPQEWDECGPINKPMPSERPGDNPEQWTAVPPRPISPAPAPEGREGTPIDRTNIIRNAVLKWYVEDDPDYTMDHVCADIIAMIDKYTAQALTASQSRETELRAAWNAREPQLYAAERTVDELRARVAELEKERDEPSIKAISAQAAARGNAKLFEKSKTQLSALQKELAESKEQWRMSSVCRELTAKNEELQKDIERERRMRQTMETRHGEVLIQLSALREAGQELAGAMDEIIGCIMETRGPDATNALHNSKSALARWHQSIAAPMGREGTSDTQRLDWLERFLQLGNSSVFTTCTGEAHETRADDTEATEWNHPFAIGYQVELEHRGCYRWEELSNGAKGIRPAIDAAMKKHGVEK